MQARSTSTRLPGKSLEILDTKTMTGHVLDASYNAARYINRGTHKHGIEAVVALLVPNNDPLADQFNDHLIYEGSEHDVLSRYMLAVHDLQPNYTVRLTGDCPLLSPPLISKHVMCAVKDGLDYCSNVTDGCRTFIDGWDVEVVSFELMNWLDKYATSKSDREHVTPLARNAPPKWATFGTVVGTIDFSDIKLSVDTHAELDKVRANMAAVKEKMNLARELGHMVYRY